MVTENTSAVLPVGGGDCLKEAELGDTGTHGRVAAL